MVVTSSDKAIYLALHRQGCGEPFTKFYASLHDAKSFIAHELRDTVSHPKYGRVMAVAILNRILDGKAKDGIMVDLKKDYALFVDVPDEVNLS